MSRLRCRSSCSQLVSVYLSFSHRKSIAPAPFFTPRTNEWSIEQIYIKSHYFIATSQPNKQKTTKCISRHALNLHTKSVCVCVCVCDVCALYSRNARGKSYRFSKLFRTHTLSFSGEYFLCVGRVWECICYAWPYICIITFCWDGTRATRKRICERKRARVYLLYFCVHS